MFASFRRTAAWLRGRWHADLEFQRTNQQRALLERFDQLLIRFDAQTARLGELDLRLVGAEALVAASTQGLSTRFDATAQGVFARLAALDDAELRMRETIAGMEHCLRDLDARLLDRFAVAHAQSTGLSESLSLQGQSVQHSLEILGALRQEVQCERQRQLAWEAHWEETHRQERAAVEASDLERERARREERSAEAQRNKLTPEDHAAIERQGVFIVGSARSGTTILSDCLNLSRDVYMLQEAFFFCNELAAKYVGWENYDFAATFNARHVGYGNPRDKGTYVPTADTPDRTPLEFLNRFRGKYRYLGEKVAFGPQPHYMGDDWESGFLAYQARHFYHSRYFITVRAPHEALWSMHKLFPDRPIPSLFECWLRSLRTSLELYLAFPHTHMILLEWLDAMTIRRISDILQTEIPLPSGWVGRNHQASALDADELVPVLQPYRAWCHECGELYEMLRAEFSRETQQFDSSAQPREFIKTLRQRITALLEDVTRQAELKANAA